MNTFYYVLETNVYLTVFYAFYKILLQKETFYSLNRFYLLVSTGLSFLLPFIDMSAVRGTISEQIYTTAVVIPAESTDMEWWQIALRLHLLVVYGLLLRLASQIYRISRLVKSGDVIAHGRFKEVQIRAKNVSFSFFNYLFINPELREQNTIRKHELVHISQKHSLDILFIELVQIANWFNPIVSLIKTDIRAIHEFIADEIVSRDGTGVEDYAMFLIHNSYNAVQPGLSNQMFNQSLLKKRIMKLSQKKSRSQEMLKYALLALLIPSMLCISALSFSKSYGMMDLLPANQAYQDTFKVKASKSIPQPKVEKIKFPPPVVKPLKNNNQVPPPPPIDPSKTKSIRQSKGGNIKFPPPVVKPLKNINQVPPPPPQIEPKKKELPPPPPMEPNGIIEKKPVSNTILSNRDKALSSRTMALNNRAKAFSNKDKALSSRTRAVSNKAKALSSRAEALSNRAKTLSIKNEALRNKNKALQLQDEN